MNIDYVVSISRSNNPPTDAQFGAGNIVEDLDEALREAAADAREWHCRRRPEKEYGRCVFYAERFVPAAPSEPEPVCDCSRHGKPHPRKNPYATRRRAIPGVPRGERYVVKVMRREHLWP